MRKSYLALLIAGSATLAACETYQDEPLPPPPPPPLGPGAIYGTMAADRNGDGIVDGWYTQDGVYHPFVGPPCPPPPLPPPPPRSGERG